MEENVFAADKARKLSPEAEVRFQASAISISFPAAYTSPENVTQEIAEDVYTAFERFLKDNVFPLDDAWRTVAETEWYVVPQDFGVYRANLDIWMPSEEYGTMHYELSGLVTFFNTQGNYSVSDFRIEVDC